jgi:hypothetical protein
MIIPGFARLEKLLSNATRQLGRNHFSCSVINGIKHVFYGSACRHSGLAVGSSIAK